MTKEVSGQIRGCVVAVGLMLVLTAIPAPAQAIPCVVLDGDGVYVGGNCAEFRYLSPSGGGDGGLIMSSSGPFADVNATAVNEDVRVTWSFNASAVDANVTAFHVERGLNPDWHQTMQHAGTAGPNASALLDDDALLSGNAVWYQVTAELDDGSTVESEPVHTTGLQIQSAPPDQ